VNDDKKIPSLDDVRAGRAIIRTQNGIYIPAEAAEKLKPYAQPPGLYDPGLSLLATPIYVLPPKPQPKKPSFWRRFWWTLTGKPRTW